MPTTLNVSSGPRLFAAAVHALWFVVPVVGAVVASTWVRVADDRNGFLRVHTQAALRLQAVAGAVMAVLLVASTVLSGEGQGTNPVVFFLAVAVAVWSGAISVLWVVDASSARLPRRPDPLTRAVVPATRLTVGGPTRG